MEHSTEPSILKVLLDQSEYERLRHIESKYIELQRQTTHSTNDHRASQNFQDNQIGAGSTEGTIVPPTATQDPSVEKDKEYIHFQIPIKKDDFNSTFDENRLLSFVPKTYQKTAKYLLEEFNKRGDEITWNSSGTIFINKIAIPLSDIFILFPLLFRKKAIVKPGFEQFVQKIYDMGLGSLVIPKPLFKDFEKNEITGGSQEISFPSDSTKNGKDVPWWYIGD